MNTNIEPQYYIGLLSGTSIDSIDAALFNINNNTIDLIKAHSHTIPLDLKTKLNAIIDSPNINIENLGKLNIELGNIFADAVIELLKLTNLKAEEIKAIGLHGQTVYHYPSLPHSFTMQLGDPNTIIEKTKITVITDFRQRDMVNGGQGAPLAPLFHQQFFHSDTHNRAIINIGGITNITLLPSNLTTTELDNIYIASDLGPGNTLLDQWYQLNHPKSKTSYDNNGSFAKSGHLNQGLLKLMLSDPYFTKAWPKSTGREYFNLNWLSHYLEQYILLYSSEYNSKSKLNFRLTELKTLTKELNLAINPEDIENTLVELTAVIIANCLEKQQIDYKDVYLCGGGAHNKYLVGRIKNHCKNSNIRLTNKLNLDVDWVEAATFAWLAYCTMNKKTHRLKHITGSQAEYTSLGCVYY